MTNTIYQRRCVATTMWNETGILVVSGMGIAFEATGTVYPWQSSPPAIGPNGQDGVFFDRSLLPTENFCKLIGKIGPNGTPFGIGESIALQANCTGYLYLAVNDGVDFADNSGYFDVSITTPDQVYLSTNSGGVFVRRAAIDTSLMKDWGVMLTVKIEKTTPNLVWSSTQKANLIAAFQQIESRLLTVSNNTYRFKQVFGGLEIRHVDQFSDDNPSEDPETDAAFTPAIREGYVIEISPVGRRGPDRTIVGAFGQVATGPYGLDVTGDLGIKATITHELGHVFDYRTRPQPGATRNNSLFRWGGLYNLHIIPQGPGVTPDGRVWEHAIDDTTEKVGDHFLNWSFGTADGYLITNPDVYDPSASDNARRISAFWVGGTDFIEAGVNHGHTPGISQWIQTAYPRASAGLQVLCSQNFET